MSSNPMSVSDTRILRIGLAHEFNVTSVVEFEHMVLTGFETVLNYTTPLEFCDYGLTSDVLAVKQLLSQESLEQELVLLGHRYKCRYVLYGAMDPHTESNHVLKTLNCRFKLYDVQQGIHRFDLAYCFDSFRESEPTLHGFTPNWQAMRHQIQWLVCQTLGAAMPSRLMEYSEAVAGFELSNNIKEYKTLVRIKRAEPSRKTLSALVKLTQRMPNLALAHYELGMQLKANGYYKHGFMAFQNAWNLFGNIHEEKRSNCATEAGICLALMDEKEKALCWWNMAIEINPSNVTPYINLAMALEQTNHFDKAESYLKQALTINADDVRIYDNLARLYSKQQVWEKAIDIYNILIRMEPHHPWHHSNLASSYLQMGLLDEAMTHLRRTTELDPNGEAGRMAASIMEGLEAVANVEYQAKTEVA
ncbi:MAG: tetratricopeptide repeat protein [Cyanobacteria bacterium HKST-UBA04]|nr:tetratricopeptide repeat protein [Cyanobacteria bacterium HKST-UBA04]MCA9842055.1 tetratricopeptide repeat protein [Cyanobacteria bacterium HKST-UBA03]